MTLSTRGLLRSSLLAGAALVSFAYASDEVFDSRGFPATRPTSSQLQFEHVDPLNGNLLLVFTDLSLPGNGGFDLKVQRTYNSKIFRDDTFGAVDSDSWAGVGWSLHLGRVLTTPADSPLAVEMPDGSSHKLFANFVGGSSQFVTRDYWIYNRDVSPPRLKLTNGVVYTFGKVVAFGSGNYYRYPTTIQDPFGNRIDITYDNSQTEAPDAFSKITQNLGPSGNPGTQKREITFTTEMVGGRRRLRTMTYLGRTWTYSYIASNESSKSLLIGVQPPVGRPWSYGYTTLGAVRNELVQLTTPWGGSITYTYGTQGGGAGTLASYFYLGSSFAIRARVVTSRVTGGRDAPAGTRTYAYAQGDDKNQTTITAPAGCSGSGGVTKFTFLGVGDNYATGGRVWKIGLLDRREVFQGGASLESEQLAWRDPAANGNDNISPAAETVGPNTDAGIYAPVLASRTITRGGQTYVTTNTYHSQPYAANGPNFNDYGRPYQMAETGDAGTRTAVRAFQYGFTPYIVDRVATETVTVASESFKRSWSYAAATGFLTDEYGWGSTTTNGIRVHYDPTSDGKGNVASARDGNGETTSYSYDWGVRKDVQTPAYPGADTIRRVINTDGTVRSVTTRLNENGGAGYTTSYTYDNLMRLKTLTPPVGQQTSYDYDDGNSAGSSLVRRTRGSSFLQTSLDGFGRVSGTTDALGVQTDISYDGCDRKSYESLPFDASHPKDPSGFVYQYDPLGRPTSRTNPGAPASSISYSYTGGGLTGLDVAITDEEARKTVQQWSAFGDPDERRLAAVTLDKDGSLEQTTSYSYNALGSLTGVSGGGSRARSFRYTVRNELQMETHPEKGTTSHTYDAAGNLSTSTDAAGTRKFGYDANNRLVCADQPPAGSAPCSSFGQDDVTIRYDRADNRVSLVNTSVSSAFDLDGANRLTTRTDTVAGAPQLFVTTYGYDGRDNLELLTYPAPSATAVKYTYDNANRITDIRQNGTPTAWASGFSYHPSGAAESLTTGNGLVTSTSYTGRHWVDLLKVGVGADATRVLGLDYGYDRVGNVGTIGDNTTGRSGFGQVLGIDRLDRVQTASGPWGSLTYGVNALGDRINRTLAGATTTYTYDSSTGRLTSLSGAETDSFGYSEVGNVLSRVDATFTYTLRNMQKTATIAGTTTSYAYDGDDVRVSKSGASGTRYYAHGPGGQLLSEFAACGGGVERVRDYVYAGARLVAVLRETPTASFAAAGSSVLEGPGTAALVAVTLTTTTGCPTTADVSVSYATANGTALAGGDYAAVSGVLRFPEGSPSGAVQTIQVAILDDGALEGAETFLLSLAVHSGASLGTQTTHTMTIQDDDVPALSFVTTSSTVSENGVWITSPPAVRIVTKDGNPTVAAASVSYSGANGSAVAGSDYQASGTVAFPGGTPSGSSKAVPGITILLDGLGEGDEIFSLVLSNPVGGRIDTPSTDVVTIADDDARATKTVTGVLQPGGSAVYAIGLVRPGTGVPGTSQAQMTDTLPSELTLTQATASGGTVSTNGNTVTWTGALGPLGTVDVTIEATIADGTAAVLVSNQGLVLFDGNGDGAMEAQALTDDPSRPGVADPTVFQVGTGPVSFYTLTPCRLVDTRNPPGSLGGPALTGQGDRTFNLRGVCGVPATAKALAVNVTATGSTETGHLRLHPPGLLSPPSTINYTAGLTRANNAVVALSPEGTVAVFCNQSVGTTVDFILDVTGYFE